MIVSFRLRDRQSLEDEARNGGVFGNMFIFGGADSEQGRRTMVVLGFLLDGEEELRASRRGHWPRRQEREMMPGAVIGRQGPTRFLPVENGLDVRAGLIGISKDGDELN